MNAILCQLKTIKQIKTIARSAIHWNFSYFTCPHSSCSISSLISRDKQGPFVSCSAHFIWDIRTQGAKTFFGLPCWWPKFCVTYESQRLLSHLPDVIYRKNPISHSICLWLYNRWLFIRLCVSSSFGIILALKRTFDSWKYPFRSVSILMIPEAINGKWGKAKERL